MKEEIIQFEVAKLAKEKGFPQNLFNTSWYNEFGTLNGRSDLDKEGKSYGEHFIPKELKHVYKRELFLAPTQSLLQKWLRDIHFIDVEPKAIRFVGDEKASYYNNYINGSMIEMKKYNSYEEALEKGLYQALLLI